MANKEVQNKIKDLGSDWLGEMYVWLGKEDGTVETGTPGLYWARYANAQPFQVKNSINAPPYRDLHVLVRRSRIQPNLWQITEILEDYDVPAAQGGISAHHAQHEEDGFDRVNLDRKQIKQLSARAAGGWLVQFSGATAPTMTGNKAIDNASLDLSAYVVTAGAQYIGIETDNEGAISINATGPNFGSPLITDDANIPAQDPGKYLLAYVLMYEGQTEILDSHIRVIMPLPIIPTTTAYDFHNATAKATPVDPDEFALADSAASWILKKVTWANIKATLKTYFDTIYSALGHTHSYSAPITLQEQDASPSVASVATIKVSNSILVDEGSNTISIYHLEPLTNGDASAPELVFDGSGDAIMVALA